MTALKVAVCECPPDLEAGSPGWNDLSRAIAAERPGLVLLDEMPFGAWIAARREFEAGAWAASLAAHRAGMDRLADLTAAVVAGTQPRELAGRRVNEGFVWTRGSGAVGVHAKQYFPDEPGYHEARWFETGEVRDFRAADAAGVKVGFLICTELMFNERARRYGRDGAHVILAPRTTGRGSLGRWLVAARMAAIVSGCFVLSSNRGGTAADGQEFGGAGWIIDPGGEVVAQTTPESPVVFATIDVAAAAAAKAAYPCYVRE